MMAKILKKNPHLNFTAQTFLNRTVNQWTSNLNTSETLKSLWTIFLCRTASARVRGKQKHFRWVYVAIWDTQSSCKSWRIGVSHPVPSKALVGMGFGRLGPQTSPLSPRKKRWSEKSGFEMDLGLIKWSLSWKAALMWSVTSYCPRKKKRF